MIMHEAVYTGSFVKTENCPTDGKPEFAVIGRSNVGKSSFINYLTGYKNLARISSLPGKTQTLNFYTINSLFYLVDLPGYGYAKVSKVQREKWEKMIRKYLCDRSQLLCTLLLIDGSIPPQKIDIEFANWLGQEGLPFAIIYTKTDKRRKSGSAKDFEQALLNYWEKLPPVFSTSAVKKTGAAQVLKYIQYIIDTV